MTAAVNEFKITPVAYSIVTIPNVIRSNVVSNSDTVCVEFIIISVKQRITKFTAQGYLRP